MENENMGRRQEERDFDRTRADRPVEGTEPVYHRENDNRWLWVVGLVALLVIGGMIIWATTTDDRDEWATEPAPYEEPGYPMEPAPADPLQPGEPVGPEPGEPMQPAPGDPATPTPGTEGEAEQVNAGLET
jgi:hypothetical protein